MPATDQNVQIFGHERDQATRAAVRFFKERRVAIHQVDLTRKPIARGELRRFVERLGARALLDETSKAYRDGGLGYMRLDDAEIVERLLANAGAAPPAARPVRQRGRGRSRRGRPGSAGSGPAAAPELEPADGEAGDARSRRRSPPSGVADHEARALEQAACPGRSRRGRSQRE